MPNLLDPHLQKVREAHRLSVIGMSKRKAAKQLKVSGHTINRLLREYAERRKAGTLFLDLDKVSETDMYDHTFQMKMIGDRARERVSKTPSPSTDDING